MNIDQQLEMQRSLEQLAFDLESMRTKLVALELAQLHEAMRKRLYRTTTLISTAVLMIMVFWGFDTVLHVLEISCQLHR